ncbi:TlpA family protein disulfide reductase [Natribacillus halophilus]|uniref:Thiol-disulfide isomerase or thioredoxin n=1 Tax=Natribacillus halophilus TaxID=549003 RepID=A0A1G8MAS1_9BACI|nr:TlpA disulfide reductase family protein [Natribacillus halophilus]SDI64983.1 Thiol-disulfide isomerase or thioredoxin [Natribacillus halophilus]
MGLPLGMSIPRMDEVTEWLNPYTEKRNRWTLIHFWSLSCETSRLELPEAGDMFGKYAYNVQCVSIHVPNRNDDRNPYEVRAVAARAGINVPLGMDGEQYIASAFSVRKLPAYYLFDGRDRLLHVQEGKINIDVLQSYLNKENLAYRQAWRKP